MAWPRHIGIIMDGNGRWAQFRKHPRTFGHIRGARVAKKIVTACREMGLENLTLYAFSTENWLRPQTEVNFLMNLLRRYLNRETDNLVKQNIRFTVIGELSRVPLDLIQALDNAVQATRNNTGLQLIFAISYGARSEITAAARALAEKVQAGEIKADEIDEALLGRELSTYPTPDPDLIIRTSGERRLSNFLLWQAAYSEFYFTETLWPDFTRQELELAVGQYANRQRRFGQIGPSHEQLLY